MELNWKSYIANGISESDLAEHFVSTIIKDQSLKFFGNHSAIYFVSSNSGVFSSITFWENALEHSPRFANPGIFPWTLANATSGYLARQFLITGPNYTIIDDELNEESLAKKYKKDKLKYSLKNALLVFWELDFFTEKLNVFAQWCIIK